MITWPAVIRLEGDDELSFVGTQLDWESDNELHGFHYGAMDQMIDANGSIYDLTQRENDTAIPNAMGDSMDLAVLTDLVRAHVSQLGHCCVSKLGFYSTAEAVTAIGEIR